jgi:hypothetical protein
VGWRRLDDRAAARRSRWQRTDDAGQDTGSSVGIDAAGDRAVEHLTEAEWQAMIAPRADEHAVDDRNASACQRVPIGQDFLVQPTVACTIATASDSNGNAVYDCAVEPYCTHHEQCQERTHGTCRGTPYPVCAYPGAERTPCTADRDCTAVPGGICPQDPGNVVTCFPTGRCDPPSRKCTYPQQTCNGNADCTAAAGGHCAKLILFPRCEYQPCMTDGDCDANARCLCTTSVNRCIPADCRSDGDCGTGQECRLQSTCLGQAYHCSTDLDSCRSNADCAPRSCLFKSGQWDCGVPLCPDL